MHSDLGMYPVVVMTMIADPFIGVPPPPVLPQDSFCEYKFRP